MLWKHPRSHPSFPYDPGWERAFPERSSCMRITIPIDEAQAEAHLPEAKPDGSGVGINYADQILKPFKQTLPDGRKLLAKRRGLKLTVTIGDKAGEAILRRLEY